MAFWGVEVKPGKPFTHTADDAGGRLHISQATLGIGTATKKSVVQCNVGNKCPVFLCSLFPEKTESCQLNLEFEEADEVVFSVIGPRSVHLTGYFLGASGRHYNLNDESESYGEDIAETETERSTGHSDEDKYEDSFINDGDPKVFPFSPVSDSGVSEMDAMLDGRKPKKTMGSKKRLRKMYQLSESDNDNDAQKQAFASGSATVAVLDSDREDKLPISTFCRGDSDHSEKFETAEKEVSKGVEANTASVTEVQEKADKVGGETSSGEAKDKGNCIAIWEGRSDAVVNGEPKRSDACDSILASSEMVPDNGAKPKKKEKGQSKKVKNLENDGNDCSYVHLEDQATQTDTKANKMDPTLPIQNEENQQTFNRVSEKDARPKKRKIKKHEEEKIFEADNVNHTNVEKDNKAIQDEMKHDNVAQDLPKRVEQNEKQVNKKISGNDANQSVTELQPEEKTKNKKRRTEDGNVLKTEKPLASMDAENRFAMDTENTSAEWKLSHFRTLPNGLVIQELETGKTTGKVAASGKKISVHYTGKLKANGQIFDSNIGNSPLKFRLGQKGVIEGLNVGLEGMRVGEKRRLLVPPSMGYGNEGDGSKNIPPNSWLEFDVKLVKVRR